MKERITQLMGEIGARIEIASLLYLDAQQGGNST
jgi:hypothetical protein